MSNFPDPQWLSPIVPDFSAASPQKLGLEVEMFGFDSQTLAPLGMPESSLTAQQLMERVHANVPGSHLKVDAATDVIVGLELGCGNFSLEPGGQLEYATCPQTDLVGVLADLSMGLKLLEEGARGEVLFLDHGTNPVAGPDLPLLVPKHRYQILDRYFASQPGGRGVHMMRYSATAQPNIDVTGQEAWMEAVNLTFALTPLARALFANSHYFNGQLIKEGSERQRIWTAIDSSRTGVPHNVAFRPDLVEAYAQWGRQAYVFLAGDLPVEQQPVYGELTFAGWQENGYRGRFPDVNDWSTHLGTLFPDLRLRRFLEVRMVDAQSYQHALAPMAFWAAALQNPENRQRLWKFLDEIAAEVGLKRARDLLHLSPDEEIFRRPSILKKLLATVDGGSDELTRRSLSAFGEWLENRDTFAYPQSGKDFVRAQATSHPSHQLESLLSVS